MDADALDRAFNITSLPAPTPNSQDTPAAREARLQLYEGRAANKRCIFTGIPHGWTGRIAWPQKECNADDD